VITEGPDSSFQPLSDVNQVAPVLLERYRLPSDQPLILYVGGISPHKNLLGLLRALTRLRHLPWHLTLVGDYAGDSFWSCHRETVELARTLGVAERITFTGYVSDKDLVVLYNLATMLVLPSISEGFGLPVVEAMACGLPVAVSNRNSLPEVVGDAGLLFDPLSDEQIADAITRLLADEQLRLHFRAAGLRRAKLFSWKTASHKMVQIIEKVAANGR
jgi:glycosyltransferase involved in cell wall biosynthesis